MKRAEQIVADSEYLQKWLRPGDIGEAQRQLESHDPGTSYDEVVNRMFYWADDYRREAECEAQEAKRFEADH